MMTYSLFVDVHQVVTDAEEWQNPTNVLLTDAPSLFLRWWLNLDIGKQLVALVGIPTGQFGRINDNIGLSRCW